MKKQNQIADLRKQLEKIDAEIFQNIIRRMEVATKIGAEKRILNIPVEDSNREAENLNLNLKTTANKIPSQFVEEVSQLLAKWARKIQIDQK